MREERGYKALTDAQREAARPMAMNLDLRGVRSFPDKNSSVPVHDQIAATKQAGAVMNEIHVLNQLGHLPSDSIPEEAMAQADLAYLNSLHREGGDRAVEEELLRRKNIRLLMETNPYHRDEKDAPDPMTVPLEPETFAKSSVRIVDLETPEIAPEHQAIRDILKDAAGKPYWEQACAANDAFVSAQSHGVAHPADYIAIARMALSASKKGREPGF